MADPEIRAVTVATPSGAHAEIAVPFLEKGKAVLCEKPLEVSLEAVDRILAAAERGGGCSRAFSRCGSVAGRGGSRTRWRPGASGGGRWAARM